MQSVLSPTRHDLVEQRHSYSNQMRKIMSRPIVKNETYRSPLFFENDQKSVSMKPRHEESRSIQSSKLSKIDIVDPPSSRRTASTRKFLNPKVMSLLPDGEFEKAFLCEKEENEDEDFEKFEREFLNRPPIQIQFKKKTKPNIVTPNISRQSTRRYKNNESQKQKSKDEEQTESKPSNQAENSNLNPQTESQLHDQDLENDNLNPQTGNDSLSPHTESNILENNFLSQHTENNFLSQQTENNILENNILNKPNEAVHKSPRKLMSLKISKEQEIDATPAPDPHLSEFNFRDSRSPRAVYNVAKKTVEGASNPIQKPKPPPMTLAERSRMLRKRNQERTAKRKAKQESMKMEEMQARRIAPYKAANLPQKVKTAKGGFSKPCQDDEELESNDDYGGNKLLEEIVIGCTDDDQICSENDHHTLIKRQKIENKNDDFIFDKDSDEIHEVPVLNNRSKEDESKSDAFDDGQIAPESESTFKDALTTDDRDIGENQNEYDDFDNGQIAPENESIFNDTLKNEDKSANDNQNEFDNFDDQIATENENTDESYKFSTEENEVKSDLYEKVKDDLNEEVKSDLNEEVKSDLNEEVKSDLNEENKTHKKEPETEIQNIDEVSSTDKKLLNSSDNEKPANNEDFEEEIHTKSEEDNHENYDSNGNEEVKESIDENGEQNKEEIQNHNAEVTERRKDEEEIKEVTDKDDDKKENDDRDEIDNIGSKEENVDENKDEIENKDDINEDKSKDETENIDENAEEKEETENINEKEEAKNIVENDENKEEEENINENDESKEETENINGNDEIRDENENYNDIGNDKSKDEAENIKENEEETKEDDSNKECIEHKEQDINSDIKNEANKSEDDEEDESINSTNPSLPNAAQNNHNHRNSSLLHRIKLAEQQARLQERIALEEAREAKAQVQEINKRITEEQQKAQETKRQAINAKEEAESAKEQLMKAKQMLKLFKKASIKGEISNDLKIELDRFLQDQNKEMQAKDKEEIENQSISLPESTQSNLDELKLDPIEANDHDKAKDVHRNEDHDLMMQSDEIFGTSSSALMEIKDNEEILLIRAKCEEIGENINTLVYETNLINQFEEEEEEADSDLDLDGFLDK